MKKMGAGFIIGVIIFHSMQGIAFGNIVNDCKENGVYNEAYGVAVTPDGDVVVVGVYHERGEYIIRIQKYNGSNGNILWQTDFGEFPFNVGKAVVVDGNGDIYIGGIVGKEIPGVPLLQTDYIIIKYDENGNKIWSETYNKGFSDFLSDIGINYEGNLYVTGMSLYFNVSSNNVIDMDFWTLKINSSNGKVIKEDVFDKDIDSAFGLDVKGNDVVVAGGISNHTNTSIIRFCTIKYDSGLNKKWIKYYYENKSCAASDAVILSDGSIAVTGYENSGGKYFEDIITILYDSEGNIIPGWPKKDENPNKDDASTIATDSNNNIIIAGYKTENGKEKWYIAKYDVTGKLLWNKLEDINGEIKRIALDSKDNIVAAGYKVENENHEYCIRKYDSNGNLLWEVGKPVIEIGKIYGGIGISAIVKNNGTADAYNISWSIDVEGYFVGMGKYKSGTIPYIPAGDEVKIKNPLIFGFGPGVITVTVGNTIKVATCYLLGPLVLVIFQ